MKPKQLLELNVQPVHRNFIFTVLRDLNEKWRERVKPKYYWSDLLHVKKQKLNLGGRNYVGLYNEMEHF